MRLTIEQKTLKECTGFFDGKETSFSVIERKRVIELIKEACKKQKEKCIESFNQTSRTLRDTIRNAPEPTWEDQE